MDDLTASNLRRHIDSRHRTNHETYKLIFEATGGKLRRAARAGATECRLEVPKYMFGRPFYDVRHAAKYVARKLERRGFRVARERGAAVMVASWDRSRRERRAEGGERESRSREQESTQALESRLVSLAREPMLFIQERVPPAPLPPPPQHTRPPRGTAGSDNPGDAADQLVKDIQSLFYTEL